MADVAGFIYQAVDESSDFKPELQPSSYKLPTLVVLSLWFLVLSALNHDSVLASHLKPDVHAEASYLVNVAYDLEESGFASDIIAHFATRYQLKDSSSSQRTLENEHGLPMFAAIDSEWVASGENMIENLVAIEAVTIQSWNLKGGCR